ncbi:MAG: M23 family metallopeptidase [Candidatus Cloacimonadota bacterium]|nr:MAG: M23 family metallopeptidase [Candidatus Cloacimonadota bacterium]
MRRVRRFSWTLSIITEKGIYQFIFKDTYLFVLLSLIAFLFLCSSLLSIRGINKRSLFSEFRNQVTVKERYIASLKMIDEENKSLKKKIDLYSAFNDKLRYATDVSPLERKLRIMGIGGPSALDTLKGKLSKSSYKIVSDLVKEVNFAEKLVDLEQTSYEEVYRKLTSIIDLKRHTPSIWPTSGYISSGFGYRRHPIRRVIHFHTGLDIASLPGTHIYATADGVVDFVGRQAGFGNYLSIDHGYGFKTKYGHLQRIFVKEGQEAKRGDLIATMGRTGLATGTHLHYEVRILNRPVNPISYIIRDTLTY